MQLQLTKLEWLNKRDWKNFQEFMETNGYDPKSVEDYMKASELLGSYRDSDPFANNEEEDWDEEDLESLSDTMEDEEDECANYIKEMGGEEEELESLGDTMEDTEDELEGLKDEMDDDGAEKDAMEEDKDEGDEDDEQDLHHEVFDGMDEDEEEFEDEEAPEEQEKRESIYRIRCEDEGIHEWLIKNHWESIEQFLERHGMSIEKDNDVEVAGAFIEQDIRRVEENAREVLAEISCNVEVEQWLSERGWPNFFQFMVGHGLDFGDHELVHSMAQFLRDTVEGRNTSELPEHFDQLTMRDNRNHNTSEGFQNQIPSDWATQNEEIQSGQDAEMTG